MHAYGALLSQTVCVSVGCIVTVVCFGSGTGRRAVVDLHRGVPPVRYTQQHLK